MPILVDKNKCSPAAGSKYEALSGKKYKYFEFVYYVRVSRIVLFSY
jgi:hypothetical protein